MKYLDYLTEKIKYILIDTSHFLGIIFPEECSFFWIA